MNATVESERTIGHADRRWLFQGIGLTAVIIVLAILFIAINPRFGTLANLINILTQASFIIVIAVGMTFVITSAGIDLSVGSAVAFITVVAFGLIKGGLNPFLGVVFMFALGAFIGCLIGGFVAYVKIPPFIATLGFMAGLRGLALVHSAGEMHFGLPVSLTYIGQGDIAGIPVPVIISFAAAAFGAWLFNRTRFGLYVKAIGGNREAARLAGVPVNRIEVMVYVLMGMFTALGGLIMMTRIDSTQATIGTAMEIHVISAVIIGGTSLFGGRGTIYGTVMGALLLSMMNNALIIAGVDFFWQLVVMGCIVLIAVAISNLREQRIPLLAHFLRRAPKGAAANNPADGPSH
ncbi:MAG: ABC transporter permease [Albidovulum sp.]|nr:ABC transporter permease [Albidovulum sp.]MDE0534509.1 ABC transporter permease [Albidovulum sp.]